jgi:Protein of unknown function (DUF5663)
MSTNNNTNIVEENITISDEIRVLFDEMGVGDFSDEMKEYVISELGDQTIERVMIRMVKDLPEAKVSAFLEFIEKGASQESLYIYLTSIYPKAEEVIAETAREIINEFKDGMGK